MKFLDFTDTLLWLSICETLLIPRTPNDLPITELYHKCFLFQFHFKNFGQIHKVTHLVIKLNSVQDLNQPTFTCSKSTIDRNTKIMRNLFKVNYKMFRTTSMPSFWYLSCELKTDFTRFSGVFTADFKQVHASWVNAQSSHERH